MAYLFLLLLFSVMLWTSYCGYCLISSHCSNNEICLNFQCKKCGSDGDCKKAMSSKPYCVTQVCKECKQMNHCTSASKSVCSSNACIGCSNDNQCSHITGKTKCSGSQCVECYDNSHCTSGSCNTTTKRCQGSSMCTVGGTQCLATPNTPVCEGGSCASCEADTSICVTAYSNYLCSPEGSCKQCLSDTDCTAPNLSQCLNSACVICSDDTHCSHIAGKGKCDTSNGCVECNNNLDCNPGNTCTNNVCVVSSTPLEIKCVATSSPSVYVIQFPTELVTNTETVNGIEIKLAGVDPTTYSYKLVKKTETEYEVHFTVAKTVPSSRLQLNYTYYSLTGTSGQPPSWYTEISSKRIPYISEQQKQISQTMQTVGQAATAAMAATSGSILALGGNPAILWALISLIQAFYYLTFINVNYPANVQFFLKIFTFAGFDFIPNPMEWFSPGIKQMSLPTPARFEEYDVNGLFLANAGNMLLIWFVVFFLYGFSLFMNKYLNRLSRLITLIFSKMICWFEWSGVLRAIITSYAETTQAAFLQMRELTYGSKIFFSSSVLGIIFSGFGLGFPILILFIVKKNERNQLLLTQRYSCLVSEYKSDGRIPKYFASFFLFRRLFINIILVFLHDFPYVEIILLLVINIIIIILLIKYQPYPTKCDNRANILCEVLFLIIHALIFVLIHDDHILHFYDEQRLSLGWVLITICGVIVVINLGMTFIEQFKMMGKVFSLLKAVIKKETRQKRLTKMIKKPRLNNSTISATVLGTSVLETPRSSPFACNIGAFQEKNSTMFPFERSDTFDGHLQLKSTKQTEY